MKSRISMVKEKPSNKYLISQGKQDPEGNLPPSPDVPNLLDILL